MATVDIQKVTGNPPAPADSTNTIGIGFDTVTNTVRLNDGTTARNLGGAEAQVTLAAARTVLAAESGTNFFLNLAGGFTVTLPTATAGLRYTFTVKTAPTTAYVIVATPADSLAGSVFSSSGGAEDTEAAATADQINFVANTAVVGDSAEVWSDGAVWYGRAFCSAAGGITFTG